MTVNVKKEVSTKLKSTIKVKFIRDNEFVTVPERKTSGAACYDIKATGVKYDKEKDCWVYNTGLHVEFSERYVMALYPRSSNRDKECYLTNSVGTIDSDYRGEILVSYKNRVPKCISDFLMYSVDCVNMLLGKFGFKHRLSKLGLSFDAPYEIGDNIAQIRMEEAYNIDWEEVKELSKTDRGEGGHGSTGK